MRTSTFSWGVVLPFSYDTVNRPAAARFRYALTHFSGWSLAHSPCDSHFSLTIPFSYVVSSFASFYFFLSRQDSRLDARDLRTRHFILYIVISFYTSLVTYAMRLSLIRTLFHVRVETLHSH